MFLGSEGYHLYRLSYTDKLFTSNTTIMWILEKFTPEHKEEEN